MFQRERSMGMDATFHFTLTGQEPFERNVRIQNRKPVVSAGLEGNADVRIRADSRIWLQITAKERNPLAATLNGKLRISGPMRLFKAFVRCFPS